LKFQEEESKPQAGPEVMVLIYRDQVVESVHRGSAVVVDSQGEVLHRVGEVDFFAFLRSAAKPFQVIPLIESGAARKFGFTNKEIAIMAGSHSGEEVHVQTVSEILDKVGLSESDLKCGVHTPHYYTAKGLTPGPGEIFRPLQHNCSGKHASMLALAAFKSWDTSGYLDWNHPVQKTILKAIAEICHFPAEKIGRGIDGCNAPVHALPLKNIAWGFATLLSPSAVPKETAKAYSTIARAMLEYPEMVSGEERFDYELMKALPGKLISKAGAEGVQCAGLVESRLGVALKIEDGATRAVRPATVELLRQIGVLGEQELGPLSRFYSPKIKNWSDLEVGHVRAKFSLK
jgi:L-asparaginase II